MPTTFETYAAQSWPRLVRTLVLLGLDQPAAQVAARTALARCMLAWDSIGQVVGRDAYVHVQLLKAAGKLPPAVPATDADLVSALGALPHEERLAVVLLRFGGVSEPEVRQVLSMQPSRLEALYADAAAALADTASAGPLLERTERARTIRVPDLDLDTISEDAVRRRTRVRIGVLVVFAVIALLILAILAAGG